MNNIKKSLVMLTLASVCVAGFAATKSAPQPSPQPCAVCGGTSPTPAPAPGYPPIRK